MAATSGPSLAARSATSTRPSRRWPGWCRGPRSGPAPCGAAHARPWLRGRRGWPSGRTVRRGRRPWATGPRRACPSASSASGPTGPSAPARPEPLTAAAAGGCPRSPAGAPSSRSGAGCASSCTSPADRGPGRWRRAGRSAPCAPGRPGPNRPWRAWAGRRRSCSSRRSRRSDLRPATGRARPSGSGACSRCPGWRSGWSGGRQCSWCSWFYLRSGRQDLGERGRQDLDVGVQGGLGRGDQQDVVQTRFRGQTAVGHAGQDVVVGQGLHHLSGVLGQLDRELVEEARGQDLDAGDGGQGVARGQGLLVVEQGHLAQASLAQQAHVDGEGQAAEARVGADVRRGLVAADVLLARGQGQDEAATAVGVHGFTAVAAGRLAQQLLAGGEQADVGTAKVQGVADRLAFGCDNVSAHFAGRLQQAHRYGFRDDDDQQGAGSMSGLGDLGDIGGGAEHVGGLDDHAGGVRPD
uniref:PE-PGRS family protein n=1 Tax=Parastrongyloides trichosuri TaxID=131310 RepID=A0A0N4ZVR4_PARTI